MCKYTVEHQYLEHYSEYQTKPVFYYNLITCEEKTKSNNKDKAIGLLLGTWSNPWLTLGLLVSVFIVA